MCVMAVFGAAPCQCFSPGGNQTTSPGRISSIGPPSRCNPAKARGDDERLAKRMRVPGGPSARREVDVCSRQPRRVGRRRDRVDVDVACEPVAGALVRLEGVPGDLHMRSGWQPRRRGSSLPDLYQGRQAIPVRSAPQPKALSQLLPRKSAMASTLRRAAGDQRARAAAAPTAAPARTSLG